MGWLSVPGREPTPRSPIAWRRWARPYGLARAGVRFDDKASAGFFQAGGKLLFAGIIGFRIDQQRLGWNSGFSIGLESGFHLSSCIMHHARVEAGGATKCSGKPHYSMARDPWTLIPFADTPPAPGTFAKTQTPALCLSGRRRANFTMPLLGLAGRGVLAVPMTSRTRFLITAALVCHLLFAHALVTSQLLSASSGAASETSPNIPPALEYENVTIRAVTQENKGAVSKLHGKVEIHYGTYTLHADEATYNSDTSEAVADGHVVLDGEVNDEHVRASHATYNTRTEVGRFLEVHGTIGMHMRGTRLMLTSSNPFAFSGKMVEKTGPNHYVVYDGTITTCELPRPKWEFKAHEVIVDTGGNAQIYRSSFRLLGIPIFYFPYATHPIERVRQSGFSMPDFGTSSTRGKIVGESMYWAINRSLDVEVGAQYFSARGWSPHGEFRARPSDDSFVDLNYTAVFDRGYGPQRMNQGGEEARLDAQGSFSTIFAGSRTSIT